MDPKAWGILLLVWIGNCGFWLFCFNQINATGLPRRRTKVIEKLCILFCFLIPALIATIEWSAIHRWLFDSKDCWPTNAPCFSYYGSWCLASCAVLGPLWIESRFWLLPPRHQKSCHSEDYHVHQEIGGSPGDRLTRFLNALPGNQIGHLQVTRKQLQLPRRIVGIDGLRIGHISDLHFTGQLRYEHYQFVLDRFLELEPDLIVLSGDIIDYDHCLPWIEPLLASLVAPYGCAFVLGNHDRRLRDVRALASKISSLGHFDLGKNDMCIALSSQTRIEMSGNERPWLERHIDGQFGRQSGTVAAEADNLRSQCLRIAVSHSPDQIVWARRNQFDLMLAGHTHGGQVRLPGVGPIVSPSRYGSRFASGVFYLAPTLLHVSRGVAGTHPLRWRCKPEISLLTLCNPA